MVDYCIACGLIFEPGWMRMATPLGSVCIPDSVPAYNVRVGDTMHQVIAWTPELLERINTYQASPEAQTRRAAAEQAALRFPESAFERAVRRA